MFVLNAHIPKPSNDLPPRPPDSKKEEISKSDKLLTQQDWQLLIIRGKYLSRNNKVSYMISKHN